MKSPRKRDKGEARPEAPASAAGAAPASAAKTKGRARSRDKGAAGPQVPLTAFNFVEAAYSQRHTSRIRSLSAAAVFLVICLGLGAVGYTSGKGVETTKQDAETAERLTANVREELMQALGGVPDLGGHLDARRTEVDEALQRDMDVDQLLSDLLAQVPAGIEVQKITVRTADAPVEPETAGATTTTVAAGESAATTPSADTTTAALTVEATGSTVGLSVPWQDATRQIDYVSSVLVDFASADDGTVTFTMTAAVKLDNLQLRRAAAIAELGIETGSGI